MKLNTFLIVLIILVSTFTISYASASGFLEDKIPNEYKGVPVVLEPYQNDGLYGQVVWEDNIPIKIRVFITGNKTMDMASFYHECYHIDNNNFNPTLDDENMAEQYSAKKINGYTPLVYN
jgi:hypothetical protein